MVLPVWNIDSESTSMTFEIALLLGLLAVALVLFCFEWVPVDVVALGLVVTLVWTGLLPASKAFAGFGSETVMMMLGLLILTAALLRTGVMDLVGIAITRNTNNSPTSLLLVVIVAVAALSAFISNTAATAFFVPIVIGLAKRAHISPSQLLMPLAFASIVTSSVTLISTSTNLVVNGLMTQFGLPAMGLFELAPVGLPIAAVGLCYIFFVGRRLVPVRSDLQALVEAYGVRDYLAELLISPKSKLVGKTLAESRLGRDLDFTVLRLARDKEKYFVPNSATVLRANDVVLVEGKTEDILKIKDATGIDIKADAQLSDHQLQNDEVALVEILLLPGSSLIGETLRRYRFRERFGLQVLGIHRREYNIRSRTSQVPLRVGDVLLVQGPRANLARLEGDHSLRVLGAVDDKRPNRKLAAIAVAIFVSSLVLATLQVVSLPVAVLTGAILVFVARCITPEEAYREVDWKAIILIGGMLAVGAAMLETGAAAYLAGLVAGLAKDSSPIWLLGGFFILTVLLTQPLSNQAAAAVILPVAIQTAVHLGLNPRTFAMMIAVAASCSYLTPLEPSCLMVYGPGRYRFIDFLKVGAPLTFLIFVLAIILVPRVWPV